MAAIAFIVTACLAYAVLNIYYSRHQSRQHNKANGSVEDSKHVGHPVYSMIGRCLHWIDAAFRSLEKWLPRVSVTGLTASCLLLLILGPVNIDARNSTDINTIQLGAIHLKMAAMTVCFISFVGLVFWLWSKVEDYMSRALRRLFSS